MTLHLPDRIEHWPLGDLSAYGGNARTHSDTQIQAIARSLAEYGWTTPILVDGDGVVIAGHGRIEAAARLGLEAAPVIRIEHLTPAQIRAYRIADNRLAELAGWDESLLVAELEALEAEGLDLALAGFEEADLAALRPEPEVSDEEAGEDVEDEVPEPPTAPVTRPGDLWLLGEQRLLCGDATDRETFARLMDGERASLLVTSPPYAQQRDYMTDGIPDWDALMQGVFSDLPLTPDAQILVNLGLVHRENEWQPYWQGWLDWMRGEGWRRFGLYVWDQGPGLPGDWNGRLAPAFEFLFHFNRTARRPNKIQPCRWAGHVNEKHGGMRGKDGTVGDWQHAGRGVQDMRIPDNVLRITRHKARGIETEHPAVFPVALPDFVMRAWTVEGELVFEPFAGSGSTLIAAQRLGRRARGLELAPEYADVALRRWMLLFPDTPPVLAETGATFAETAAARGVEIPDAA